MSDAAYTDDDIVYVDPDTREVLGKVEFDAQGNPQSKPFPQKEDKKSWRTVCPYGTYKSMKSAFRLVRGSRDQDEEHMTFDDALSTMLNTLF